MNQEILRLAATHFPRDVDGNISATPEMIVEFAETIIEKFNESLKKDIVRLESMVEELEEELEEAERRLWNIKD